MFSGTAWYDNQPEGMIYIGKVAYEYKGECPETLVIKDGTLGIAACAIQRQNKLKTIVLPNSLTNIGAMAIRETGLTSLTIPDSVTSIGGQAFCFCNQLKSVTIGKNVKNWSYHVFLDCNELENITFTNGLIRIGNGAFQNCESITDITIPDSVTHIGSYAFFMCENLKSVTIPKNIISIGDKAFGYKNWSYEKTTPFTIYGYTGSDAKRYADDNGFSFISLGSITPTAVKLNKTSVSLAYGKTCTLTATVSPSNAVNKAVTWSTSNKAVATVSAKGVVTAKGAGTATITAKTANGKTASCKVTVTLAAPKITKLTNTAAGVQITIGKVSGAVKYRYLIKSGKTWKKLGDSTGTTFVHKAAKSGAKYTYSVCCISKDGKQAFSSYNKTGWAATFIGTPSLPTLKNTKNGVQIGIKKVAGAAKYRILRKTGKGKWVKVADTTKLSYVDKTAKKGVVYTYTICCVSANGKAATSAYNTKGKAIKCIR